MTSRGKGRDGRSDDAIDSLRSFRQEVDRKTADLASLHAVRLQCRAGCSQCCIDDLSVHEVEADVIRRAYADLLETGVPHAEGACAFLDEDQCCRVYPDRPYICRTQGLPLRWFEAGPDTGDAGPVELRDICPLNLTGDPIESLPDEACWLLGPFEERLGEIAERFEGGSGERVRLRDLFRKRIP